VLLKGVGKLSMGEKKEERGKKNRKVEKALLVQSGKNVSYQPRGGEYEQKGNILKTPGTGECEKITAFRKEGKK